jgi:hypothetical protein
MMQMMDPHGVLEPPNRPHRLKRDLIIMLIVFVLAVIVLV